VSEEIIEFLRESVDDPRFAYHHVNAHNELYNPEGDPLSEETELAEGKFDVICLYSVFTHLAPHNYRSMLKLLRRYVKPDGRLVFTLFIDEPSEGGAGRMDTMAEAVSKLPPDKLSE
jgi:cyclopropane fatty-acyl-phospholipid synthase-like methyltransferase